MDNFLFISLSLTITNSQGCRFPAEGAHLAASINRWTSSFETASSVNALTLRRVFMAVKTSKATRLRNLSDIPIILCFAPYVKRRFLSAKEALSKSTTYIWR
jgi:hypothetical protein